MFLPRGRFRSDRREAALSQPWALPDVARMQIASMASYWLESESWAGECAGSWRTRVMVLRVLLARIGTVEGRIVGVVEGQEAADAVGRQSPGVGLGQLAAGVRVFAQVQDYRNLHVQLKACVAGCAGVVPGAVQFGAKAGAWLVDRVYCWARGMSCTGVGL